MTSNDSTTSDRLADAIAGAIATVLGVGAGEGEASGPTVIFSGEGPTPADAARDAIADIVEQCCAHRCSPVTIAVDGAMGTDEGYRAWGRIGCRNGDAGQVPAPETRWFDIVEGEGGGWTLTMSRE